jgi:acyl-CoA synthetase (AMP-forming)/AMP-acid ligase II
MLLPSKPKGCILTVASWLGTAQCQFFTPHRNFQSRRLLHTSNFRVIAPATAFCAWRDGATIVLPGPGFTPPSFLDTVEQERVTDCVLIPALVHLVVTDSTFATRDTSSLRAISSGGNIVTSALVDQIQRHFPSADFMVAHGMSEGGGFFQFRYDGDRHPIPYYGDVAALGRVSPGTRIRVVQDGATVKRSEVGELHIQSGGPVGQYMDDANQEASYSDEQGRWFRTGDLGMINHDDDIFILGRLKDVIKRSGVSITPAALESCLSGFINTQVFSSTQ